MSLSQQLSGIAQANQTLVLDRKRRSKLHSVSLIHPAKYAATQDFESIYASSLDALRELESLDGRFSRFHSTLFSETSINVDRQVQSKEHNDNLNKSMDAFLDLLAPYWKLSFALEAAEWPLRRFQMNVSNSERLLLSALPHYGHGVFLRVLHVVVDLPPLFSWLANFKKVQKSPSRNAIVKAFTDFEFCYLYGRYVGENVNHNTHYELQLVFYTGMLLATLSHLAAYEAKLLEKFVTPILEVCGMLLVKMQDSNCQVTAYTILSVLACVTTLSADVVVATVETIINFMPSSFNTKKRALGCIVRLFVSLPEISLPPHLAVGLLKQEGVLVVSKETKGASKLAFAILLSVVANDLYHEADMSLGIDLLEQTETSLHKYKLLVKEIISQIDQMKDRSLCIPLVEAIIKKEPKILTDAAQECNVGMDVLEMKLQMSFSHQEEPLVEETQDGDGEEAEQDEVLATEIKFSPSEATSFLHQDDDFYSLIPVFLKAITSKHYKQFNKEVFCSPQASISFLLRVSLTWSLPSKARLFALQKLRLRVKEIQPEFSLHTLVPIIVALLNDTLATVRSFAVAILRSISEREQAPTRCFIEPQQGVVQLSIADGAQYLQAIVNHPILESCKTESECVFRLLNGCLSKKLGPQVLASYATEALNASEPFLKSFLIRASVEQAQLVKGASSVSSIFEKLLDNYQRDQWADKCQKSGFPIEQVDRTVCSLVSPKEKNPSAIAFLEKALKSDGLDSVASERIQKVFPTLKLDTQVRLAGTIVEEDCVDLSQSLDFSAQVFLGLLQKIVLVEDRPNLSAKRRRRSSAAKTALQDAQISQMAGDHLKKLTKVIELLDRSREPLDNAELLKLLFAVLGDLDSLGSDANLPVMYAQETLASVMYKVVKQFKKLPSPQVVRPDVVVASIRESESPQVQNKLLLVMSALASLAPETVLHSVMPIFTFMGAHTVRQDDAFSSHVVEQTVLSVVPALANAAENGRLQEIELLLTSFVTAFDHIPRHRRVTLFTTLCETLSPDLSLHIVLFLCGHQYAAKFAKHRMSECEGLKEFVQALTLNFSPNQVVAALSQFVELWKEVPEQPLTPESPEYKALATRPVFGTSVLVLSKNELFNLRRCLVEFVSLGVLTQKLGLKVARFLLSGNNLNFGKTLESVLSVLESCTNEIRHVWNNFLTQLLDVLPIEQFSQSGLSILQSQASLPVKRQLLLLAGSKFSAEPLESSKTASEFVILLLSLEEENVQVKQSSYDALSSITSRFGTVLDPKLLTTILGRAASELRPENAPEVIISCINCISSIVLVLGVKCIGFYPKIVNPAFQIFDQAKDEDAQLVQTSVLVLFSCLVKRIPAFVASNMTQMLTLIFKAHHVTESTRTQIIDTVVSSMELEPLLKSLCSLWELVSGLNPTSIGLYLHAMELTIEKIDKRSSQTLTPNFMAFIVRSFEYRSSSDLDTNAISRIEASLFECAIQYVMKLNDKTFRPFFASMSRWAFDGEGTSCPEQDRLLVFFKFFNKLQESLRSIVTSYYNYLLENVESILERFVKGEVQNTTLRRVVLISLSSSFRHDQDEYWQLESRFEGIAKCLTSQLSNIEDGLGKHLVKAISALSQDCFSDDHNRILNQLLMSHVGGSSNKRERYWTVRTYKMIYIKNGEKWLSLLPQLVPLIAELLEDEDEDVELEVRSGLVNVIENVMGEPLDRYLS